MTSQADNRRRVVVTGMGAITPLGLTVEDFWQGLLAGRSGIDYIRSFDSSSYPCRVAGEIPDFDPHDYIDRREARRMARFSQLAVAAARDALSDSGLNLESSDRTRIGVIIGVGGSSFPTVEEGMRVLTSKGGMRLEPLFMPKLLPNMAAAWISLVYGLKGYTNTVTTACAASTQAIGEAMEVIRSGRADMMIAGGAEAGISELGLAAFCVMRALTSNNDPPQQASRPFDAKRDGFVPAEGAALLVLESLEHAVGRGATILAEVAGYGVCSDAYHIVAPCADGEGAARAIRWALDDAGVQPADVDYINAHGTSTPLNDTSETLAIKAALSEHAYNIPISSTKSMIGHGLGAAGALESVACVKTLQTGMIHPTINYEFPDPECDLDYVPGSPRRADVEVVLKNSFGFGGQNACLVFKRYPA